MDKLCEMVTAAHNAMISVLNLTKNDRVLIVFDKHCMRIGDAFHKAALEVGCQVAIKYQIVEEDRPLSDIPAPLLDLLVDKTVVINAVKALPEETPFRINWCLKVAESKKTRIGHAPGITEAMMTDGPMNVDYDKMLEESEKLLLKFKNAKSVHITTHIGTDLHVNIEDRVFLTDVKLMGDALECNLPCGEIYTAPIEDGANGVLVIDLSIGHIGRLTSPAKITVKEGKIENIECKDSKTLALIEEITSVDDEASIIGELGVGLNPGARLKGSMLEDEKALLTAHIAFGSNEGFPGSRNRSKTHNDLLFYKPTFEVTYKDGSRKIVIQDGDFNV